MKRAEKLSRYFQFVCLSFCLLQITLRQAGIINLSWDTVSLFVYYKLYWNKRALTICLSLFLFITNCFETSRHYQFVCLFLFITNNIEMTRHYQFVVRHRLSFCLLQIDLRRAGIINLFVSFFVYYKLLWDKQTLSICLSLFVY